MAFGIKADLNENGDEGLKPLEDKKPIEQVKEPVEKPNNAPKEDAVFDSPVKKKGDESKVNKPLEAKTPTTEDTTTQKAELNDEQVSAYLKSKYVKDREFETLGDLFKSQEPTIKEVEKTVNPYEDVLDDWDKAYLDYKKETGRTLKEFEFLQQDISKLSPLDLAQKQVQETTGMKLSKSELTEYLEDTLGIDLADEELSTTDKIKLNSFVKPTRESYLEQQEKYRKPLEAKLQAKANQPKAETVQLEDGSVMPKAQYEQLLQDRKVYEESVKKAVDSVASFDLTIPLDNNGEKTDLSISYELSKEDKHSMLSDALDVDATIKREFQTDKGFNHSELAQTLYRGQAKNFNKIISAMAEQVRASTIEELTARSNNESFTRKPLDTVKTGKNGYGELPSGNQRKSAFGVKASGFN